MQPITIFRDAKDAEIIPATTVIFREGEAGDSMFAIQEGEVEITVDDKILDTLGPDEIFGEMSLINEHARTATAVAKTECKIVAIDRKRFLFLVEQTPFFALQVMGVLADRVRRMNELV